MKAMLQHLDVSKSSSGGYTYEARYLSDMDYEDIDYEIAAKEFGQAFPQAKHIDIWVDGFVGCWGCSVKVVNQTEKLPLVVYPAAENTV